MSFKTYASIGTIVTSLLVGGCKLGEKNNTELLLKTEETYKNVPAPGNVPGILVFTIGRIIDKNSFEYAVFKTTKDKYAYIKMSDWKNIKESLKYKDTLKVSGFGNKYSIKIGNETTDIITHNTKF
ncbi:hypothetical protein K9L97_00820 [Candidatus Woesearchaeota archaeon]|nr:hypothetical protein [Candidatus Woesearchaeota archaeon]